MKDISPDSNTPNKKKRRRYNDTEEMPVEELLDLLDSPKHEINSVNSDECNENSRCKRQLLVTPKKTGKEISIKNTSRVESKGPDQSIVIQAKPITSNKSDIENDRKRKDASKESNSEAKPSDFTTPTNPKTNRLSTRKPSRVIINDR